MSDNNGEYYAGLRSVGRFVVKIGSSSLTHETGDLNLRRIEELVKVLSDLANAGREPVLVTSGAVAAGAGRLGLSGKPGTIREKQACAAVGQAEIMALYARLFALYGRKTAQVLLTRDAVEDGVRRANAEATFETLIGYGCIPVVNENDTISSEEIKFSGNDILSAYVSGLCKAGLLINLSDVDGLYDSNPNANPGARMIPLVTAVDKTVRSYAGGAGSSRGTGGMGAKLDAAEIAAGYGIPMIIANARNPSLIYDIFDGYVNGTLFNIVHNDQ